METPDPHYANGRGNHDYATGAFAGMLDDWLKPDKGEAILLLLDEWEVVSLVNVIWDYRPILAGQLVQAWCLAHNVDVNGPGPTPPELAVYLAEAEDGADR